MPKVKAAECLQVWHLYDLAKKMISYHRLCPDADVKKHDAAGFVQTSVQFDGTIVLEAREPPVPIPGDVDDMPVDIRDEDLYREKVHRERMQAYIAAKKTARATGKRIPTLAEFEGGESRPIEEDKREDFDTGSLLTDPPSIGEWWRNTFKQSFSGTETIETVDE